MSRWMVPYVNLSHGASSNSSLFFWFWKINSFFLPSPFFEFTITIFSSLLSTLYIINTSTGCSRPFQDFYKVYYPVACGLNSSYIRFYKHRVFLSPRLVARRLDSL